MKVVIAHRTGQPRVVDLPEQRCSGSFVTVRVSHTAPRLPEELGLIDGAARRLKKGDDGFPLGGCASGTIIEVGPDVRRLKSGLRVAVTGAPYVFHATQLTVPENLVAELPKKVNHEEGSFAGQGAEALHLVRTARVQLGETVLIFGAELLGLMAAQVVRAAGATPILVDDSEFRLNKIRTLGVTHALEPNEEQLIRLVDAQTEGLGVDSAMIVRPNDADAFRLAMALLRPGGVLVLAAPLRKSVPIDALREKKIVVTSTSDGGPGAGDRDYELGANGYPRELVRWTLRDNLACFCGLLAERKVQITPLVSDRIPLERAPLVYEKAARSRDSVLGAVLTV